MNAWWDDITKLIKNLLEGLGLLWRVGLCVNRKLLIWLFFLFFQKLCIVLFVNKLEGTPFFIITSREASESCDYPGFLMYIGCLVIWKAIKMRWDEVTGPEIEISRNVLPFIWGDLLASQALGRRDKIRGEMHKVTQFWGFQWNQLTTCMYIRQPLWKPTCWLSKVNTILAVLYCCSVFPLWLDF